MKRFVAVAALLAISLAGCTATTPAPEDVEHVVVEREPEIGPDLRDLVGDWTADVAAGGDPVFVRIGDSELAIWDECGIRNAYVSAFAGIAMFTLDGVWSGCKGIEFDTDLPWLDETRFIEVVDADQVVLLSADREPLATLNRGGTPPTTRGLPMSLRETLTADDVELPVVAPLPAEAEVADSLAGDWIFEGDPEAGTLEITETGWGWDGCLDGGGQYTYSEFGSIVATGGNMTALACGGNSAGNLPLRASTVGFVDGDIRFYDAEGEEIRTLVRA
jgi:hypothetical protein